MQNDPPNPQVFTPQAASMPPQSQQPPVTNPAPPVNMPQSPTPLAGEVPILQPVAEQYTAAQIRTGKKLGKALTTIVIVVAVMFIGFSLLFGLIGYASYTKGKHLQKVGISGQAVIVSTVTNAVGSGGSAASGNNTTTYVTDSTYRLLNIKGYESQIFHASTNADRPTDQLSTGEHVAVVYDPANPRDNELASALAQNSSPATILLPISLLAGTIPFILIITVVIRRAMRRNQAIKTLQS